MTDHPVSTDKYHQLKMDNTFLIHAMKCQDCICDSEGCFEMKQLILHSRVCNLQECQLCKNSMILCFYHTWVCNHNGNCSLPFCSNLWKQISFQLKFQEAIAEMEHDNSKPLEFTSTMELKNSIQAATENVLRHGKMIKRLAKNSE